MPVCAAVVGVTQPARAWFLVVCLFSLLHAAPARAEARRIVSLAPSATEILFALGVGERVIGVSTYCDHPAETARIDKVGTFLSPNVERIVAKKPDLVIAVPSPGNQRAVESMQQLGLSVLVVDPDGVASILAAVQTIADAVGAPEAGRRLRKEIEARLRALQDRLAEATPRSVLMAVDRRPLIVVGAHTYQDELIRLARGINLGAKAGNQWPHVGLEFAVAQAPEVIIDTAMGNDDDASPMDFWRTFSTIPAVREGRVYGHRAFVLLRPGPRVAEALETVARFIHPEMFEEAATDKE
jgi:iron complex transport system substrate-binding protein